VLHWSQQPLRLPQLLLLLEFKELSAIAASVSLDLRECRTGRLSILLKLSISTNTIPSRRPLQRLLWVPALRFPTLRHRRTLKPTLTSHSWPHTTFRPVPIRATLSLVVLQSISALSATHQSTQTTLPARTRRVSLTSNVCSGAAESLLMSKSMAASTVATSTWSLLAATAMSVTPRNVVSA
jgi:hypothetical protein